jgi:uncharacterized spore protein YtfJ
MKPLIICNECLNIRLKSGELFSIAVNGQVYGQSLVVGSTVIVAMENDWVYGFGMTTAAAAAALSTAKPASFGQTPVGGGTGTDVSVTASATVTADRHRARVIRQGTM